MGLKRKEKEEERKEKEGEERKEKEGVGKPWFPKLGLYPENQVDHINRQQVCQKYSSKVEEFTMGHVLQFSFGFSFD